MVADVGRFILQLLDSVHVCIVVMLGKRHGCLTVRMMILGICVYMCVALNKHACRTAQLDTASCFVNSFI